MRRDGRRSCARNPAGMAGPIGLAQLRPQHLADVAQRQRIGGEDDLPGLLERPQPPADEIGDLLFGDHRARRDDDPRERRLPPFLVRDAEHGGGDHQRVIGDHVLDLGGVDIKGIVFNAVEKKASSYYYDYGYYNYEYKPED